MNVRTKLAAAALAVGALVVPALGATAPAQAVTMPASTGYFLHTPASMVGTLPTFAVASRTVNGVPVVTSFSVVNASQATRTYSLRLPDDSLFRASPAIASVQPGTIAASTWQVEVPSHLAGQTLKLDADGVQIAQVLVV